MKQLFYAEWKLLKKSRIYVISSVVVFLLYILLSLSAAFFTPEVSRYGMIVFFAFCFFFVWFIFFWPDEQSGNGRMRLAMTKYERLIFLAETKRSYYISRLFCILALFCLGIISTIILQLPFLLDSFTVFWTECKACIAILLFDVSALTIWCILLFDRSGYLYMVIFGFFGGTCGFTVSQMEKDKFFEDKLWVSLCVVAVLVGVAVIRYIRIYKQEKRG